MTVHQIFPENYTAQLSAKTRELTQLLAEFTPPDLEVFESPRSHYRMRAEFKIWHQDNQVHYAMYQPGEYRKPFVIKDFPVASEQINALMPLLLRELNQSEILKKRLFQAEFLNTLTGDTVITLIYHKPLSDEWHQQATLVAQKLGVSIIGRSRKQKRVIGRDFVEETLTVNQRPFHYQQVEASFTQPNAKVCEKMLAWAVDCAGKQERDLLELYCGNANFTIPLSFCFRRVIATEISKTSVKSARCNLQKNDVGNVEVVRMSSEEFAEAMSGTRRFQRLADISLQEYDFSTVLVDPPRAGLDDLTVEIVSRFERIIYISCNPQTLKKNLEVLTKTHTIIRFALFDQFPYTHHIESGVLLIRKDRSGSKDLPGAKA
ncbi:MAG: tRNA (uridine(54)-C5)-methyltransferase TrmA [Gammaproteobacteria bacterium]|nr:MAG: tRNA (uridine(54)-C5)-methyltransferase TrmA [Gammaproteobacteria bacterium]